MFKDRRMLIERCIGREERAWGEFVEQFSGLLYYSARERLRRNGIVFDYKDLEDIVQAVFLEIWEKARLAEVKERKKISSWLSIMAQTRALNYMQRKKERLLRQDELYRIDNIKLDTETGIDEKVILELEKAIEDFDARTKIIFKLNVIYGKRHKEIAGFIGVSVNTVSTIIARKKNILKKKFKDF